MISIEMEARPSVLEISGDLFSVQLMKRAPRSEKSHRLCWHSSSCMVLSVIRSPRFVAYRSVRLHSAVLQRTVLRGEPRPQTSFRSATVENRRHASATELVGRASLDLATLGLKVP